MYHCQVLEQGNDFNLKPGVSGVSYRDNINKYIKLHYSLGLVKYFIIFKRSVLIESSKEQHMFYIEYLKYIL